MVKQQYAIKQIKQITARFEKLNPKKYCLYRMRLYSQFIASSKYYSRLQQEIDEYKPLLTRGLNINFAVFIMTLCYITYLLTMTVTSADFKVLYMGVYMAHLFMLANVINGCNWIYKGNPTMQHHYHQLSIKSSPINFFTTVQMIKVCSKMITYQVNNY